MTISVFDLFSVGVGPSSSHTVGPMRAAARFVDDLRTMSAFDDVRELAVDLYGSLAATGAGHGTMTAVLLGLEGHAPETITTEVMEERQASMAATGRIVFGGHREIDLAVDDIVLRPLTVLPFHPNGMKLTARAADSTELHSEVYFSVGGGFVVTEAESVEAVAPLASANGFASAKELLQLCERRRCSISDVMTEVELERRDLLQRLLRLYSTSRTSKPRGLRARNKATRKASPLASWRHNSRPTSAHRKATRFSPHWAG